MKLHFINASSSERSMHQAAPAENRSPKPLIFTAADLWNIDKQKRSFVSRRGL